MQTRIGIATGLVVIGDLIGWEKRRSEASSGRRRTLRRVCRGLPSQTRSSSQRAPKAPRQLFELQDLGQGSQGHRGAGAGLGGAADERG